MNNLSLLIYAADILPSVASLATVTLVVSMIVLIILTIIVWSCPPHDMSEAFRSEHKSLRKSLATAAAISVIPAVLIPEQNTFYLIAASEGAQVALSNPDAQEMFSSVKEIIQLKLDATITELKQQVTK